MPRTAIATGMVDWVLPVAEMPARLVDYFAPRSASSSCRPRTARAAPEAAARRPTTTKRRCATCSPSCARAPGATSPTTSARRSCAGSRGACRSTASTTCPATWQCLRTHPGEAGALLQDLLISVTNFFRDRDCFDGAGGAHPGAVRGQGRRTIACASGCRRARPARRRTRSRCCWPSMRATLEAPPVDPGLRDRPRRRGDPGRRARASTRPRSRPTCREERLRRFFIKEHARLPGAPRAARDGAVRACTTC